MRNINIKLSVSERSEDLIKIAAMQFFFAEMPNRSSTFGYTQFKNWKLPDPMAYQEVFVPRIEYSHLNYMAMLEEVNNFILTTTVLTGFSVSAAILATCTALSYPSSGISFSACNGVSSSI